MAIEALKDQVAEFGPTSFLLTVGADSRAHVVSVRATVDGPNIRVSAGRTSRANASVNSAATLLWPARAGEPYSLIVDGEADVAAAEDELLVRPTRAVLHRVADAPTDLANCVAVDDAQS